MRRRHETKSQMAKAPSKKGERKLKINGQITLLSDGNGLSLELRDKDAAVVFAKCQLTPMEMCQAFGRQAYLPVTIEVKNLDRVGLKLEVQTLEFPIPKSIHFNSQSPKLTELANKHCPKGWTHDNYFTSSNSLFYRDEVPMARVTIRRWVERKFKRGGKK